MPKGKHQNQHQKHHQKHQKHHQKHKSNITTKFSGITGHYLRWNKVTMKMINSTKHVTLEIARQPESHAFKSVSFTNSDFTLPLHYDETVDFLPFSSKEFIVLIWSSSEGWKAELTLEPTSGFEPGTPGLGIQSFKNYATAPFLIKFLYGSENLTGPYYLTMIYKKFWNYY